VHGNVNVSKFGTRIAGIGGFVNITQTSKEVVFMGSLTAKGLEVEAADGRLRVRREGEVRKVVPKVGHLSFNGACAAGSGTKVLYITERAVFEMRGGRLTLTEIAPGVDLEREVRAQVAPGVGVAEDLRPMDARIFRAQPMLQRP
jgi:propionate CoA-transferase